MCQRYQFISLFFFFFLFFFFSHHQGGKAFCITGMAVKVAPLRRVSHYFVRVCCSWKPLILILAWQDTITVLFNGYFSLRFLPSLGVLWSFQGLPYPHCVCCRQWREGLFHHVCWGNMVCVCVGNVLEEYLLCKGRYSSSHHLCDVKSVAGRCFCVHVHACTCMSHV